MTPHEYVHSGHCADCKKQYDRTWRKKTGRYKGTVRKVYYCESCAPKKLHGNNCNACRRLKEKAAWIRNWLNNRDALCAKSRARYWARRDNIRSSLKERYAKDPSFRARIRTRSAEYHKTNPHPARERMRAWKKNNPERFNLSSRKSKYTKSYGPELAPTLESLYQLKMRIKLHEKR